MGLTFSLSGKGITSEPYYVTATSNVFAVDSVKMEVYLETGAVLKHTLEHGKDAGTSFDFTFNIADIIKSFYTFEFYDLATTTIFEQENVLVSLKFYEYTAGVYTGSSSTLVLSIPNMTFNPIELNSLNLSNYDMSSGTGKKFLTSSPLVRYSPDKKLVWLAALKGGYSGATPLQEWVADFYNKNGTLIQTVTEDLNVSSTTATLTGGSQKVNISVLPLNLTSAISRASVKIYIRDKASPFTVRSEVMEFRNYNFGLTFCEGLRIHWLNELGVQDFATFNGRITKKIESKAQLYERYNAGSIPFAVDYNETYEIDTLNESPAMIAWLSKSLRNKRAALEKDGVYFDIEILDNETTIEDNLNPEIRFALKFKFAKNSKGIQ